MRISSGFAAHGAQPKALRLIKTRRLQLAVVVNQRFGLALLQKKLAIIGYEVILEALTADESLNIQSSDTWSRRHMGCGIFAPLVPRSEP